MRAFIALKYAHVYVVWQQISLLTLRIFTMDGVILVDVIKVNLIFVLDYFV